MSGLRLHSYQLTPLQVISSTVVSTYAIRHLRASWNQRSILHFVVGLLELTPGLGLLLSIIERIIVCIADRWAKKEHEQEPVSIKKQVSVMPKQETVVDPEKKEQQQESHNTLKQTKLVDDDQEKIKHKIAETFDEAALKVREQALNQWQNKLWSDQQKLNEEKELLKKSQVPQKTSEDVS